MDRIQALPFEGLEAVSSSKLLRKNSEHCPGALQVDFINFRMDRDLKGCLDHFSHSVSGLL